MHPNSDTYMHHRVNAGVRDKHWGTISIEVVFKKVKIDRHRCRVIKKKKRKKNDWLQIIIFQQSENYMRKYFWDDKKEKKESYEGFYYNNEV